MKKTWKSKPFILFYIATLITTIYYVVYASNTFDEQKASEVEYVDLTVELVSDGVDVWFEQNIKVLETIAIDFVAIQSPEEIQSIIEAQQNNTKSAVMYVGLEDNSFISTNEDYDREGMANFKPTERPWYTEAISANDSAVVVSEPYADYFHDGVMITFSKYIGEIDGKDAVVAFDVMIEDLVSLMSQATYEFIDYFFLVDNEGGIAYHPNEDFMPDSTGSTSVGDIPGYESLLDASKEDVTLVTDFDGQEKYLMSAEVDSVGWYVVAAVDQSAVYSQIINFIVTTLPIYVIVIVLFLSTAIIYRRNEQLKKAKEEMQISNSLYDAAISNLDVFIFDYDVKTGMVRNSPAMCEIFGIEEELNSFPNYLFESGVIRIEDSEIVLQGVKESFDGAKDVNFRVEMKNVFDDVAMYRIKLDNITDSKGGLSRIVGVIENISKVVELEIKSSQDLMTGLLNKHTAIREVDKILSNHDGSDCALFVIDIDDFKTINDLFGHATGDIAILDTSNVLISLFTESDILCRYGGDEFVAFVQGMNTLEARKKAIEINSRLQAISEDKEYKIALSIGISLAPKHGKDFTELFEAADKALYKSKEKGKSTYSIYV